MVCCYGALSAGDSIDSCGRRSAYQLSIDIHRSRRSLANAGSVVLRGMGANFHRAMVATAPGEERLIGRRPVRNWTQLHRQSLIQMVTPYDIKLVFVQKITFVLRKINKKTAATRAALFDSNVHHMVCRLGLRTRPHWGSLQRSPRPPSCI